MNALQPRDRETLDFIRSEFETHGICPSFDEVAVFIGAKSRGAVRRRISRLVAAGLLRKLPYHARALELIEAKDYHLPNCDCDGCAATRYFEQLKLIKGLKVDPPVAVANARYDNIRPLDPVTRAELLGKSDIAAPRTRKTALPGGGC